MKIEREYTYRELKKAETLAVGDKVYAFDDVHDWWHDENDEPVQAMCVGLVDEDGGGWCSLQLTEDGYIENFDYDFDENGYSRGDDIPFDEDEIIIIRP